MMKVRATAGSEDVVIEAQGMPTLAEMASLMGWSGKLIQRAQRQSNLSESFVAGCLGNGIQLWILERIFARAAPDSHIKNTFQCVCGFCCFLLLCLVGFHQGRCLLLAGVPEWPWCGPWD